MEFMYIIRVVPSGYMCTDILSKLEKENDEASTNLLNASTGFAYLPLITKPTRITHSSATLIENIYTNLKAEHWLNFRYARRHVCPFTSIYL